MGGSSPTESAASIRKKRNTLPVLKSKDRNGNVTFPFLDNPDDRDVTIFTHLIVSKPFATAKGKGVVEGWQSAVDEINSVINKATGRTMFHPPIAVKTVRDRFDNVMKIIKEISNSVPFTSGCDDEDAPNSLKSLLEDLYEVKVSFEEGQQGQKVSALAQKKQDRAAAKAIQDAAIGRFSSSEGDETEDDGTKNKRMKTNPGDVKGRGSLKSSFVSMCDAIDARKTIAAQELALKRELLKEQMAMKKIQLEEQLKMKKEAHDLKVAREQQEHNLKVEREQQQLRMNEKVLAMMDMMLKKKEEDK